MSAGQHPAAQMLHGRVYHLPGEGGGGGRSPQNTALLRSSGIPPGASSGAAAAQGCPTPPGPRPSRGPPPGDTGTVTPPALCAHGRFANANTSGSSGETS